MAQSYMVFDFGTDEDTAQLGRHKIEAWKQGFRLGNKMTVKFDRQNGTDAADAKSEKSKKKSEVGEHVRLVVKLDFSPHEKLSYQRWLDRIPSEEPFKSAKGQVIHSDDTDFEKTVELFDSI